MKKAKFGLGLVLGAIAGVVTGLLAAPKPGKETRKDIKRKAEDMRDDAMDRAEDLKKHAQNKAQDLKERVQEYRNKGERVADKTAKALEDEDLPHPRKGK